MKKESNLLLAVSALTAPGISEDPTSDSSTFSDMEAKQNVKFQTMCEMDNPFDSICDIEVAEELVIEVGGHKNISSP